MAEATTAQRKLTDRLLASVKGANAPYDIRDTEVPGLRCRVMPSGECSFVLLARFPKNPKHPTRRALGTYPVLSLADARAKAIEWKRQIGAGIDPVAEVERRRREEERKQAGSFAAVAEQFIAYIHHERKLRTASMMEHDLRKTFVAEWGSRSITDIRVGRREADHPPFRRSWRQVSGAQRLHTHPARVQLELSASDDHGLQSNPCDRLSPTDLIGAREPRDRVLTDSELRAFWRATDRLKYPHGPLYKLLVLSGVRLGEVCGARWSEFDLERREWTIPAARMKKTRAGAKAFVVPLTVAMLDVHQGSAPIRVRATACSHLTSVRRRCGRTVSAT